MGSVKDYFSSLGQGISSLLKGMQVTGKEFITPKITEKYPEDRNTVKVPERFRAILTLKYDEDGRHKCIACGMCERSCPNGTIHLTTKMVDTPTERKRRSSTAIHTISAPALSANCVSPTVLSPAKQLPSTTILNRQCLLATSSSRFSTTVLRCPIRNPPRGAC